MVLSKDFHIRSRAGIPQPYAYGLPVEGSRQRDPFAGAPIFDNYGSAFEPDVIDFRKSSGTRV